MTHRFAGGHGEALAHVGEGLATALECLDDLSEFRSSLTDVQGTFQFPVKNKI